MLKAGIIGVTGYTGMELVRILHNHPEVEITYASSLEDIGLRIGKAIPHLDKGDDLVISDFDISEAVREAEFFFVCLPHGKSMEIVGPLRDKGAKVVDMSADFRLTDPSVYERWYGPHTRKDLIEEAVYGMPELHRDRIRDAELVANPGCYTTTTLLALQPIIAAPVEIVGNIIIDAKSGVSGAGRAPKPNTHFIAVADNFSPYSICRTHRHLPEMEQVIAWWRSAPPPLIFSPHLLPVPRGILANIYVPLASGWQETQIRDLYAAAYQNEPFVQILPPGELATLAHVTHTNRCAISLTFAADKLILTSATDNLLKGAAG